MRQSDLVALRQRAREDGQTLSSLVHALLVEALERKG
jgi:hypothetical protein